MAKRGSKKAEPGQIGHNSGDTSLTSDQEQALFFNHKNKIAKLKEKLASANGDLRAAYKEAKSDGFLKKEFDFAFSLDKDEDGEMSKERRRQIEIAKWMNHPIGLQADLFDSDGNIDRRPLRDRAHAEGRKAGLEGKDCKPPYSDGDGYDGWLEGWHDGQAVLAKNIKGPEPEAGLIRGVGNEDSVPDDFDIAASQSNVEVGDADGNVDAGEQSGDDDDEWPDDEAVTSRQEEGAL